jgi:hypothetical protein
MRNPKNRSAFSANGAPIGFGQQRGASPYLDRSHRRVGQALGFNPDDEEDPYADADPYGGYGARTADFRDRNSDGTDDRDQHSAFGPGFKGAQQPAAAPQGERTYDYIPGAESVQWGNKGKLSGFNTAEWGPGGTEGYDEFSYKNTFGKLASNYASNPESVRALVNDPEFRKQFPNAELVDHETDPKIRFEPGDEPVDVLIESGAGGWGWQPEDGGGGAGPQGGLPAPITGALGFDPTQLLAEEGLGDESAVQRLLQQLLLGDPEVQRLFGQVGQSPSSLF